MRDHLLAVADYLYRLSERIANHPHFGQSPVLQGIDEGLEWAVHGLSILALQWPPPSPVVPHAEPLWVLVVDLNQAVNELTPNTLSECLLKNAANYHLAQAAVLIEQLQQQTDSAQG